MLGQTNLIKHIDKLIEDNNYPRFAIITGAHGQGKKTLAKHISTKLGYLMIPISTKIEDVRTMINNAYVQTEPIIYLIADADKMSIGARNSLLKVIEEPPNNAYFIITLETLNNTLSTIKSRCIEFQLEEYTDDVLNRFINMIKYTVTQEERFILLKNCTNYYEIELFIKYGIEEFYEYVNKVFNNIYKVQGANAFKLAEKLDIKGEDESKYNLNLFFKIFIKVCADKILQSTPNTGDIQKCIRCARITQTALQDLKITGISKQGIIDNWILDIREVWR